MNLVLSKVSAMHLRLVGFAGSCLVAFGAVGAGLLPRPDPLRDAVVLSTLRHGTGRAICVGLGIAGIAVLVLAWLLLARCLGHTDTRWLFTTAALWSMPLLLAPPILSRDVYSYAVTGQMLASGLNPYHDVPADLGSSWVSSTSVTWRNARSPYGPLFLLLAHLVAAGSGGSLIVAVFGMRLLAVIGTVLLAWALPRAARCCGVDERRALWLGLVNPLLLLHFIGGAHADALMVGFMVAGLAVATGRWPAAGAVLCALAVTIKAVAIVALPFVALLWLVRLRDRQHPLLRAIGATALVSGVSFVMVTAVSGVGFAVVGAFDTAGVSQQWTSLPTGLGLAVNGAAHAIGIDLARATVLEWARGIGLLTTAAVLVWLWIRAVRLGGTRLVLEHCGWALAAVVVLGPTVHAWYATWPLAVLAAAGVSGRARTAVAAISVALCFMIERDGFSVAGATERVGVVLDVLLIIGLLVIGVVRLRRRRSVAT
ncbi:MAG: polyprenol phosphomannose-dependent alpha 1,6 mannosyltransferase MptB [Gaiellaceae bacterium]